MSEYGEGERVFGPPGGTYDADWVASAALQQDPGLPPETARMLAGQCWSLIRATPPTADRPDAAVLSRQLMADNPDVGATATNAVATAAVAFCETYGVTP